MLLACNMRNTSQFLIPTAWVSINHKTALLMSRGHQIRSHLKLMEKKMIDMGQILVLLQIPELSGVSHNATIWPTFPLAYFSSTTYQSIINHNLGLEGQACLDQQIQPTRTVFHCIPLTCYVSSSTIILHIYTPKFTSRLNYKNSVFTLTTLLLDRRGRLIIQL